MVIKSENMEEENSYSVEEITGIILQIAIKQNYIKRMALPQIEWVDYRMSDERQRPIRSDSGHQESVAGIQC